MYWNGNNGYVEIQRNMINYNMRCIETTTLYKSAAHELPDKLQHEMYWNKDTAFSSLTFHLDKLQHEMYWNFEHPIPKPAFLSDKLQHEMYWNDISALYTFCESLG